MKHQRPVNTLEQGIILLRHQIERIPLTVSKILYTLSGKGRILILLVLSLPFCQPLQIPGLSTPFGLAIAWIGIQIAFGKQIWLPKRVLSKKISRKTLNKVTAKALWLIKKMKRWVHPRMKGIASLRKVNGLLICMGGLLLALPLPIPFSNLAFAWCLFLVGIGMLENDGLFILFSYVMFVIACAILVLMGLAIKAIV